MEPFSIAVGIVGVLAASEQASRCLQKLRSLRHAHSDIVQLAEEIAELQGTLSDVSQVVRYSRDNEGGEEEEEDEEDGAREKHWRCQAVNTLDTLGHKASSKLSNLCELIPQAAPQACEEARPGKGTKLSKRVRIKEEYLWTRNRYQVRKLQADLRSVQLNMLTSLSVISSSAGLQLLSRSATTYQQTINFQQTQFITNSINTDTTVSNTEEQSATNEVRNLELSSKVQLEVCNDNLDGKAPMTRRLPEIASGTLVPAYRAKANHKEREPILVRSHRACEAWCSCQCHKKAYIRSSYYGSQLYGSIFACSNGMVFGFTTCTENHCRGNARKTFKLMYRPPSWLANTSLQLSFLSDPLYGPELTVRLPRSIDWNAPVWKLAVLGDMKGIKTMFEKGEASAYDVNPLGGSLLHYAVDRGYFDLSRFLLQQGATPALQDDLGSNPTAQAWSWYFSGKLTQDEQMFVRETFGEEHIQSLGFSILLKCILGLTKLDLTSMLEASTADIDVPDASGRTCLSWAAFRGDAASVETLLKHGANVDLPDEWARTPLHHVQSAACCELLVKGGADIDALDDSEGTPLHLLTSPPGNASVVKALVAAGANLRIRNTFGDIPLVNAAYNGFNESALALIEGLDASSDYGPELDKAFGAAVLFRRYEVLQHLRRFPQFDVAVSQQFLDAFPGSETETHLLKWFQETRNNRSNYEVEHQGIVNLIKEQVEDSTSPKELESRGLGAPELDLIDTPDSDEIFEDAKEYSF